MSRSRSILVTLVVGVLGFVACSGDGNGGGGAGVLVSMTVTGASAQPVAGGQPATSCPSGAFVNTRVTFRFAGALDAATLPADGPATGGSITIVDISYGTAAVGTWTVDAANPALVHFDAASPTGTSPCAAGLIPAGTYLVTIEGGGAAGGVITVGGVPVPHAIVACFQAISCDGTTPSPALSDRVPGPPAVVSTTPLIDSTAPLTSVAAVTDPAGPGSIITLDFDQEIDFTSVSTATVLLANTTANADRDLPVAADVSFLQQTPTQRSRITITTAHSTHANSVWGGLGRWARRHGGVVFGLRADRPPELQLPRRHGWRTPCRLRRHGAGGAPPAATGTSVLSSRVPWRRAEEEAPSASSSVAAPAAAAGRFACERSNSSCSASA